LHPVRIIRIGGGKSPGIEDMSKGRKGKRKEMGLSLGESAIRFFKPKTQDQRFYILISHPQ
jgi:hypothetical protein